MAATVAMVAAPAAAPVEAEATLAQALVGTPSGTGRAWAVAAAGMAAAATVAAAAALTTADMTAVVGMVAAAATAEEVEVATTVLDTTVAVAGNGTTPPRSRCPQHPLPARSLAAHRAAAGTMNAEEEAASEAE